MDSTTEWILGTLAAAGIIGAVVFFSQEPAHRQKSRHRVASGGSKWSVPDRLYRDGLHDVGPVGAWWRVVGYYDGDPEGFAAWRRHSGVRKPSAAAIKAYG